ncbi:MAG: methyltransferase domain-containing protein [Acidobacteria bacterium]|nr:methyltransferase domain-containing protein [Acidobacteriota bacterium]
MTVTQAPNAELFFDALTSYQKTAAIDAALELDLFTAIDEDARTAEQIAARCKASPRGVRILSDYLTVNGFLTKRGNAYGLTPDSSFFLSKNSPAYMGSLRHFLLSQAIRGNFDKLPDTVRRGYVDAEANTVADENPVWVEFARAMVPLMMPAAQAIAGLLAVPDDRPTKILDIAAGHGMFGITLAQRHPRATVVAVDWQPVLAVAEENAARAGIADRYQTRPGSAFSVDFGSAYDVVLLTNFLHHFDSDTCTTLLQKVGAALNSGGQVAIVEFVPNPDRVSPAIPASFALTMLAGTPSGDVYTFDDLKAMLGNAGFHEASAHSLPTPQTLVVGKT